MNDIKKVDRTCATCACFGTENNPMIPGKTQTVCRLNSAMLAQAEIEQPVLDQNKQPMFLKDGKTLRTQKVITQFFVYPPMSAELTCFAGWRPIGTEPGQRGGVRDDMDVIMNAMEPLLNAIGIFKAKIPLDG